MIKLCSKCNIEKPVNCFHRNNSRVSGLHDQCKECRLLHYNANKKRILEYNRSWNKQNPNRIKQHNINRSTSILGRALIMWHGAKNRAADRNEIFELNLCRIEVALMGGCCERTNIPFDFSPMNSEIKRNLYAPSIDKIDPFKPYTDKNTQIVVWIYNALKGQNTDEQVKNFILKAAEHLKNV